MQKSSDIKDMLSGIGSKAQDAGSSISKWYGGLNPDVRNTLARGLLGAGAGAAITGGMSAMVDAGDPEHKRDIKGQALMGALLGGTAAAGLPAGLKLLSGSGRFGGEDRKPLAGRMGDAAVGGVLNHPAAAVGGALAVAHSLSRNVWGQLYDEMRDNRPAEAAGVSKVERIKAAIRKMSHKHDISQTVAHPSFKDIAKSSRGRALLEKVQALKLRPGRHIHPGRLAVIPAAVGGGMLLDKYLKGEY